MIMKGNASILGAIGSFVTLVLIYHILKLNARETYTHYLDSTEITNYTQLQSLLSVEYNGQYYNMPQQKSHSVNYDLQELKQLAESTPLPDNIKTTVIIRYETQEQTSSQIDFILRQTIRPTFLYVICSEEQQKSVVEFLIKLKEHIFYIPNNIVPLVLEGSTDTYWFSGLKEQDIQTEYVILLKDSLVRPGKDYFEFVLRLLQQPQFSNTLVGSENEQECQQRRKTHYVKSIHDIWVLRQQWFLALLQSERSDVSEVSLDLYQQLHIPSVLIPSNSALTGSIDKAGKEDCKENTDGSVMFYLDEKTSLPMKQLVCQFGTQHDTIYVVSEHGLDASVVVPTCVINASNLVHYTISSRSELNVIVDQLQAKVVIHQADLIQDEYFSSFLEPATETTFIKLPHLQHDVSWMASLPIATLQQWHVPSVKLIVTTSGSKKSPQVKRIFNSIKNADYLGDRIDLSILMDEKSDGLTSKFVNSLEWTVGEKSIRHRISDVHPMQIFTEAWYPSSDHEYAIMLNDHVEVSTTFYIWIKYNLLKYRYSTTTNKQMFGISLYSPRIVDTEPSGRILLNRNDTSPYLMQAPCSSGALYFPQHWREFHDYMTARLTDQATVKRGSGNRHLFKDSLLVKAKSNKWLNSWRKYFDEVIYMRGYVMLYPPTEQGYSTLHIVDTNFSKKKKELYASAEKLFNVPLSPTALPHQLPDLASLAVLDLHGKPTDTASLLHRGHELQRKFSACEPKLQHNYDPSDMLCPFSQLIQIPIEQDSIDTKTVLLVG